MKAITFAVPCYNSADYMGKCIESILACDDGSHDIELIIVDDGSTKDDTPAKADEWQARFPEVVRAVHQENGGHGAAVNTGLALAQGVYYKVVDSDDWLDAHAMERVMAYIRSQAVLDAPCDLVIANYVYEKVHEGTQTVMRYDNVFPTGRPFGWGDVGRFGVSQYLLMHSVIYRTALLRSFDFKLPEHCFYVDNIFVYEPLPHVRTMYYLDEDMYRYFIGREGQSVDEKTMMARVDQQLKVTRTMIDQVALPDAAFPPTLERYMESYLSMMMVICTVFLRMRREPESDAKLEDLWAYLERTRPALYPRIRHRFLTAGTNLPGEVGRAISLGGYHVAQKLFNFN